jgi:hypothetical protein
MALKPTGTPGVFKDDRNGKLVEMDAWIHHFEQLTTNGPGFSNYMMRSELSAKRIVTGWHFVLDGAEVPMESTAKLVVNNLIVAKEPIRALAVSTGVERLLRETRERMDRLEREVLALRAALGGAPLREEEPPIDPYPGTFEVPLLLQRDDDFCVELEHLPANLGPISVVLRGRLARPAV